MPEEFKSLSNKFLKVASGVILTNDIDDVIFALDPYFEHFNRVRWVVSGLRTPDKQLDIIIQYCVSKKVQYNFTINDVDTKNPDGTYVWQLAWSTLLDKGLLINPPRAAKCLGTYKHGILINPSPHFRGIAFDISSSRDPNGNYDPTQTLNQIIEVAEYAVEQNSDIGIVSTQEERQQDCLHFNCESEG